MLRHWFSNSIRRNIAGAWVPAYRTTGAFVEDLSPYRQNGILTDMDPASDWIIRDGVPCLDFDNSNDLIHLGNLPHFSSADDATVLAFLRTNAQATGVVNSYFASYNTGSPYQGFGLDCGGSGISTGQALWDGSSWKDSSSGTTAAGNWQLVGASLRGNNCQFWANGSAAGSVTSVTRGTWTGAKAIGPAPAPFASTFPATVFNGQIAFLLLWQRSLNAAEVAEVWTATKQEFWRKGRRSSSVFVASTGITGSATITEADDMLAATGALQIKATASITEGDDLNTAAAIIALNGVVTTSEADDTLTATGTIRISGTSGVVEADDTLTATGALQIKATASITEADDTLTAIGSSANTGSLNVTEADDTLAATGALQIKATASITEGDDLNTAAAIIALKGVVTTSEAEDTLTATGRLTIAGVVNVTEGDDTVVATGVGSSVNTGSATITEANDTLTATGTIRISGSAGIVEDPDTLTATAKIRIAGVASIIEANDTLTATGVSGTPSGVTPYYHLFLR